MRFLQEKCEYMHVSITRITKARQGGKKGSIFSTSGTGLKPTKRKAPSGSYDPVVDEIEACHNSGSSTFAAAWVLIKTPVKVLPDSEYVFCRARFERSWMLFGMILARTLCSS